MNNTITFLSSFLISYLSVPFVNRFGIKFSILDNPNFRKQHSKPFVRLGGISIFFGFLIPIFFNFYLKSSNIQGFDNYKIFLLVTFLFFALGILDDIFQLSFFIKLICQIAIASYGFSQGFKFNLLEISTLYLSGDSILYNSLIYFVTVIWIVGIVNAFNWVDGLDGLASGLVTITSFGLIFIVNNGNYEPSMMLILLAFIASNIGFIFHNFYPAKIFMGDGGSYFIGSVIAFLSINKEVFPLANYFSFTNLVGTILMIGLPLLDMTNVIFIRLLNKKSPFYPDRSHFHHKLIDFGLSHKKSAIICYFIQIILLFFGLQILKT